ncbi:flagellar protein FlgN [Porphyrobacter sp. HT-58-2]|uniref:flagellar protein FlgN n=1 Tax=Porphyrobacter sp. HT-58-2 TaxID=2023229 RepID=UPI000CDBB852|nr:flagellar protein FlgN [Porphyrobacter sp. HT-58-2]AUX68736.1 flagellar protein FlgN [Porphyrobacter sp. HT-58-2]
MADTLGLSATAAHHTTLAASLRQMIAVLERERHALAALDADDLIEAAHAKESLCDAIAMIGPQMLDGETRGLAETARKLNDVNRRVRNLLAANVAARIEALGGGRHAARASYTPARA